MLRCCGLAPWWRHAMRAWATSLLHNVLPERSLGVRKSITQNGNNSAQHSTTPKYRPAGRLATGIDVAAAVTAPQTMCGRTTCAVREGGTGEVEAEARWITCTRRETAGTEPIRRTGHAEPVPYFTLRNRQPT